MIYNRSNQNVTTLKKTSQWQTFANFDWKHFEEIPKKLLLQIGIFVSIGVRYEFPFQEDFINHVVVQVQQQKSKRIQAHKKSVVMHHRP